MVLTNMANDYDETPDDEIDVAGNLKVTVAPESIALLLCAGVVFATVLAFVFSQLMSGVCAQ